MLELVRVTRFKLITTFVIALIIHLHSWIKPRVLTYFVENSEFTSRKPELQKLFQEFFLMVQGDIELVQRITMQSFATNVAVIILLSYAAACIIAKMKITEKRSAGISTPE
jgi:hypothetical protein